MKTHLPTGHRALLAHLIAGGLIQQDESGLAWVSASRSNGYFANEAVARVRERGFSHQDEGAKRQRFKLVESDHPGKFMATVDTTPKPKREPPAKVREARKHAPRRPTRKARERSGRLT
jgi:hypothetical protein